MRKTVVAKKGVKKPPMKKWVNSTKVEIDGIMFDSTMESRMYSLLKASGLEFEYIGGGRAEYNLIPDFSYLGGCHERVQKRSKELKDVKKVAGAGYTPDFRAKDESWFIEVKGRKLGDFSMRWKLFKSLMSKREPMPTLFMPVTLEDCKQVIKILKEKQNERQQD